MPEVIWFFKGDQHHNKLGNGNAFYLSGARIVPDPKFFVTYKSQNKWGISPQNNPSMVPSDDLVVSEVEEEDIGVYECRATNPMGKVSDFAKVHLAGE